MSYVLAAYGVVLVSLAAYGASLWRERRQLVAGERPPAANTR